MTEPRGADIWHLSQNVMKFNKLAGSATRLERCSEGQRPMRTAMMAFTYKTGGCSYSELEPGAEDLALPANLLQHRTSRLLCT